MPFHFVCISGVVAKGVDVHLDGRALLLGCESSWYGAGSRSDGGIPAGIPSTLIDFRQNINLSGSKTHSHFTIYCDDIKAIKKNEENSYYLGACMSSSHGLQGKLPYLLWDCD